MARKAKVVTDADTLNRHHERTAAGFYSSKGGRFFSARMNGSTLQVSNDWGESFRDILPGETFRDHNGRPIYLSSDRT